MFTQFGLWLQEEIEAETLLPGCAGWMAIDELYIMMAEKCATVFAAAILGSFFVRLLLF